MARTVETLLPPGCKLLAAFKCGRMNFDGKVLTADPRKGWLMAAKSEEGLLHLQWVERNADSSITAQQPELDTIVFPGETTFKRAGNPAQRVFMLRFPEQADRNMFFWMQEPLADGDEDLANRMQAAINSELSSGSDEEGEEEVAAADALGSLISSSAMERGHTSMAQGAGTSVPGGSSMGMMPQAPGQEPAGASMASQLAMMLSGMSQQRTPPSNSAGGPPSQSDMASALAAALAQAMAGQQGQQQQQQQRVAMGPSLHEVLKPEALEPLLKGPQVLERLSPFLPEQHRTPEALAALARSSQFQQQLHTFSVALQTGQLDLQQFGLRAQGFTAADFLLSFQELVDREAATDSGAQQGNASTQGPEKAGGSASGDAMQE